MNKAPVYKAPRIHTASTTSGLWVSMIVSMGTMKPRTKHSRTETVTRVPEEYPTREEATQAAQRDIDDEDSHRQD